MSDDLSINIDNVIVWTETGNACACGGCDTFGKRTLSGVRHAAMVWPSDKIGSDYLILAYREDATELADALGSDAAIPGRTFSGALAFREFTIPLSKKTSDDLALLLRGTIAPMLRERPAWERMKERASSAQVS